MNLKSQGAAACLAISIVNNGKFSNILGQLWTMMQSQEPAQLVVAALTIGEYGKIVDLSGEGRILPTVQRLFTHPNDDVKSAASICLGNVSIGNASYFLEKVFELVENSQGAEKSLFLNTIREIILTDSQCLTEYFFPLTDLLMTHSKHESQ